MRLKLLTALYLGVGVPLCTAFALFLSGVGILLGAYGEPFDLTDWSFWSAVAFIVGPVLVVGLAVRAWRRVGRGEVSFLAGGLTRAVPFLIGVGAILAAGMGLYAYGMHREQLARQADSFCWTWEHRWDVPEETCLREAEACLGARPLDEPQSATRRLLAVRTCMEGAVAR